MKYLSPAGTVPKIVVPPEILNISFHQRGKRLERIHLSLFLADDAVHHLAQSVIRLICRA